MKQAHFRESKLQARYQDRGMICPAELCDIFECPEFSEKRLRLQVYKDRTDQNYEGKIDYRDGTRKARSTPSKIAPFRYEMVKHYNSERKATLL
jgi:hypothetical protein